MWQVTFVARAEAAFWPHHWDAEWRADSHVHLPWERVLDGSIDVRAALRRLVESGRAAAMQRTIGEYAHRMHYGFDGGIAPPGERDGVANVWRALHDAATRDDVDAARGGSSATSSDDGGWPSARAAAAVVAPAKAAGDGEDEMDDAFL